MAVRNDVTINWEVSPREATVDAPSVEITMQDLYDTLRYMEAQASNIDNKSIVIGSGKVVLDGEGNAVGLTVQLINATVGFEARSGPTWIECNLTGGNLSGLEDDKETVTTIVTHNNPYVNINKTSSVSATISESTISNNLDYGGVLHYDENSIFSGQDHPIGTSAQPVNNIADGIIIAAKYGLSEVHTSSNLTLDRDVLNLTIVGKVPKRVFNSNGFKADYCKFSDILLVGDFNDSLIVADNCGMQIVLNIYGALNNCYYFGRILIAANQNLNTDNCQSGIPGLDSPEIDMNPGVDTTLSSRMYSGGLTIANCDTPGCIATLSFADGGKPHLEPSCTAGLLSVRGIGFLDDRSNGTVVEKSAWLQNSSIADAVWDKTLP